MTVFAPDQIRLLLVEDNPGDVRLVREMLAECPDVLFELWSVNSLAAALGVLASDDFDVLLLDLSLPDSQGLDALSAIQVMCPNLPIVVLSGFQDRKLAVQAVKNGAQDYLVKGRIDNQLLVRALQYGMERKRSGERLAHLAQYDALTDMPNRSLFRERLQRVMERARRRDSLFALMFLDLDGFKPVNDEYGHDVGDQLLCAVAERLSHCVRAVDTAARLGGDEFTVILDELSMVSDSHDVAAKIINTLSAPYHIEGEPIQIGVSIGIALYPEHGLDVRALIRNADAALYSAKRRGGNSWYQYREQGPKPAPSAVSLEEEVEHALEEDEFELEYLPVYRMEDRKLIALEALLRWRHPTRGLLLPERFMLQIERSDYVHLLARWVVTTACRQYHDWRATHRDELRLAVNLSPMQAHHSSLPAMIEQVLARQDVPARSLQIEINESTLQDRSARTHLRQLKEQGVNLYLDDFGTGLSALNTLQNAPLNGIKLDRTLISSIDDSSRRSDMVTALIRLGHSLDLDVIAEGVERRRQYDLLRGVGCDACQGYLFGRPLQREACSDLLRSPNLRLVT